VLGALVVGALVVGVLVVGVLVLGALVVLAGARVTSIGWVVRSSGEPWRRSGVFSTPVCPTWRTSDLHGLAAPASTGLSSIGV
jgi:hypothetical protein